MKLQSITRGRNGRRTTAMLKDRKEQNQAATKLQSRMRGRDAKKGVDKLRFQRAEEKRVEDEKNTEEKMSSTRLQALYRGNLSRKNNKARIEDLKREKAQKVRFLNCPSCPIFSNSSFSLANKLQETLILARAVIRMQCGWRKNRARRVFRAKKKQYVREQSEREGAMLRATRPSESAPKRPLRRARERAPTPNEHY
jgi:hypothetical protein